MANSVPLAAAGVLALFLLFCKAEIGGYKYWVKGNTVKAAALTLPLQLRKEFAGNATEIVIIQLLITIYCDPDRDICKSEKNCGKCDGNCGCWQFASGNALWDPWGRQRPAFNTLLECASARPPAAFATPISCPPGTLRWLFAQCFACTLYALPIHSQHLARTWEGATSCEI